MPFHTEVNPLRSSRLGPAVSASFTIFLGLCASNPLFLHRSTLSAACWSSGCVALLP